VDFHGRPPWVQGATPKASSIKSGSRRQYPPAHSDFLLPYLAIRQFENGAIIVSGKFAFNPGLHRLGHI
jgi:hypothetical protein